MKLWLDDIRPAPEGWEWVLTADDAIDAMRTGTVTHASLDNDLGEDQQEGRRVVYFMAENDLWPSEGIDIHSANTVAVEYMRGMVERYAPLSIYEHWYRRS